MCIKYSYSTEEIKRCLVVKSNLHQRPRLESHPKGCEEQTPPLAIPNLLEVVTLSHRAIVYARQTLSLIHHHRPSQLTYLQLDNYNHLTSPFTRTNIPVLVRKVVNLLNGQESTQSTSESASNGGSSNTPAQGRLVDPLLGMC